ncbi:MAG: RecX family transcriptional regulator [Prevotellaceae bacterium]|nr:RecX family transcriptional regulator [Prevotellaceae bacterium]
MTNKEILNTIEAFCAACERCAFDVQEKLQKMGAENIDEIIQNLKENNYLNEQRYCEFYTRDKFRFNHWGKTKIAYMLSLKKIDKDVICQALNVIDDEQYISVLSDIFKSKAKSVKAQNPYEKEQKLFHFALSRGFESDIIKKVKSDIIINSI